MRAPAHEPRLGYAGDASRGIRVVGLIANEGRCDLLATKVIVDGCLTKFLPNSTELRPIRITDEVYGQQTSGRDEQCTPE
jgi:hypothetical protein